MTRQQPILVTGIAATLCFAATSEVFATSIGVNFVANDNSGVQDASADSLTSSELAGVPGYAQSNWNNYGRWSGNTNAKDSLGTATSVGVSWDATGTYVINSNPMLTGDDKLMHGYLDSNGATGTSSVTSIYSPDSNKPIVFVTGISSWLSSQSASSFDVIIYFDGDAANGRVGQYWLQQASGPNESTLTSGADLTPHLYGRDSINFSGSYVEVGSSATSAATAADGNYVHFSGLSADIDSFLIRADESNFRAPISGFQLIAVVPEPSTVGLLWLSTLGVAMLRRRRHRCDSFPPASPGIQTR